MRILVAEDGVIERRLLELQLVAEGFEVSVAVDGAQAWRVLQAEDPPKLAVLDWVMPGIDGVELTRMVRARQLPLYIVVVTGLDAPSDVAEAFGAGADDYIVKPWDPAELLARIRVGVRTVELQAALGDRIKAFESALLERQRAEAALRKAEAKFRLLFASSPLPMLAYDPVADRFREVNDKALALYGYSRQEFLEMGVANLAVREAPPCATGYSEASAQLCQHRPKSGETIWVEISCERVEMDGRELVLMAVQNVTERRAAEQRLRLQATILESAANGMVITQRDHRMIWVNPAFTAMTGYPREDLLGHDFQFLLEGSQSPAAIADLRRTIVAGETWHGEVVNRRKDGTLYTEEVTVTPVRDEKGAIANFVGITQDVTPRKRAEAELAHSQDMLRILMDHIPDCIYFKDVDGRYTLVNAAQASLLGLDNPLEACGRTDFEFLTPEFARESYEDERQIVRSVQALVSKPEPVQRPGWSRWVTATKVPVKDESGRVVGIVGIARDITQWKEAEEALRRSGESFRLLFDSIPHPVWVFDPESLDFIEVNAAAVRNYGYSREEFLRMNTAQIRTPEEDARWVRERPSFTPEKLCSGLWKHRTKEGRTLDVEIGAHGFEFKGRKAVLVVAQDVTERKRLEVELQHARKLEAVGSLAAGIAHELNTPIQYVGDNIHFLQDSFASLQVLLAKCTEFSKAAAAGQTAPPLIEDLAAAVESADLDYLAEEVPKAILQSRDGMDRVATIVRAMKEFAHPGQKAAADLNKALQNALIVTRSHVKYVADVETDLGELPPVFCHVADLNQVFLNLLINAADAIADVVKGTGTKGRIVVRTGRQGDTAVISISDTGCGIPNEVASRVFEPFFTTKEVGRGSGQGLAVARSIVVEKHGGSLTFETQSGQGTTFFVRLPIQPMP
jgi:PAS domain S-box-containing protein